MTKCSIECTAIPDGFDKSATSDRTRVRLSLLLTPNSFSATAPEHKPSVELETWPTEVPRLQFRIWVGLAKDRLVHLATISAHNAFEAEETDQVSIKSQAWWTTLWQYPGDLTTYLHMLSGGGEASAQVEVKSYDYADLVQQGKNASLRELTRAYSAFHVQRSGLMPQLGGLKLRAAQNPNDPLVRIMQSLTLVRSGLYPDAGDFGEIRKPLSSSGIDQVVQRLTSAVPLEFAEALDPEILSDILAPQTDGARIHPALFVENSKASNSAFEEAMQTDEELDQSTQLGDNEQYAHQVIGAFQAHPALRKFARQIADLYLDTDKIRTACGRPHGDLKGLIAVEVVQADTAAAEMAPQDSLCTAFVLRTEGHAVFEPCPRNAWEVGLLGSVVARFFGTSSSSKPLPLSDGFVKQEWNNGISRFQIASIDAIASYYSQKMAHISTLHAYRSGAHVENLPTEPPGLRTRGLTLLDLEAKSAAEYAESRTEEIASDSLLFAEDLVQGYRVDVVAPSGAVFPAGARRVGYEALAGLTASQMSHYPNDRDDGYVFPLQRTWSAKDGGKDKKVVVASQVLFTWTGRPLGLPTTASGTVTPKLEGDDPHVPPPRRAPGLGVEIGFDPAEKGRGPILRLYGRYRFMLRVRKLNGSSVPLSSDRVDEFALGSQSDKAGLTGVAVPSSTDAGYKFGFAEKSPAPTLLVEPDYKPAYGPDPADRETIDTILVTGQEPKVRWLVSPINGFDLAELQKQFDPKSEASGDRAKAERRARHGAYRYLKHGAKGGFATVGDENDPLALKMELTSISSKPPETPHFVDATVRTVAARLVAMKATPEEALKETVLVNEVAFFSPVKDLRDFEPDDVVPIRLEVRAAPPGEKSSIRLGAAFKIKIPGGKTLSAPTICVDVAQADTLSLEMWTNRTTEAFLANPVTGALAEVAKSRQLAVAQVIQDYSDIVQQQRVASWSDVTKVRIEYPVNRPLSAPEFFSLDAFRASTVDDWKKVTDDSNGYDLPDAAKIFVSGKIGLDRKSTGEVWAEAFWFEESSKGRVFRTTAKEDPFHIDQSGLYSRERPLQRKRLFSLAPLPLLRRGSESVEAYLKRANIVDLLLDERAPNENEKRPMRNLSAEFDCDQHRILAVRLVARSRFAPADATNNPSSVTEASDDPGLAFTKESATPAACRRALEQGQWLPGVFKISLLATRRPPPPVVTKDSGTIYLRELRPVSGSAENELVHTYRCWLDSDWNVSGPGEKLAIVCRRHNAAPMPDWADAQVSRWGGDAAIAPRQKLRLAMDFPEKDANYLLAEQIASATIESALLQQGPSDNSSTVEVSLACLKPTFHDGFGRWYCDIELKATGAFRAAMKLSLARFQKDAISGRQLSSTVPIDVVMLHQPWRFGATRKGQLVEVTVTGPAYTGLAPMLSGLKGVRDGSTMSMVSELVGDIKPIPMQTLPQMPLIFAELERYDNGTQSPLPVLNGGRAVVASNLDVAPRNVPETIDGTTIQLKSWSLMLPIPPEDEEKQLAVRISLASAHANSHARSLAGPESVQVSPRFQPSALDGSLILLPEPVVVQLRLGDPGDG